jgi:hypothetical protein
MNLPLMNPDQHNDYKHLFYNLVDDPRVEFLLTNDERDFLANLKKTTHIHWPIAYAEKLDAIADKLT